MNDDFDPFAAPSGDKTVLRPNPGGRNTGGAAPAAAAPPPPPQLRLLQRTGRPILCTTGPALLVNSSKALHLIH